MLPKVIATSVIRLSQPNEAHGKIYIVDLENSHLIREIDWKQEAESYDGRGGDRGLRGIEFYNDNIIIATSRRLLFFDRDLVLLKEFSHDCMGDVHEITRSGKILYLISSRFDSILEFDIVNEVFLKAHKITNKLNRRINPSKIGLGVQKFTPWFRFIRPFYPKQIKSKPIDLISGEIAWESDYLHLNSLSSQDGNVYFSGSKMNAIYCLNGGRIVQVASIPFNTHNARLMGEDRAIFNFTMSDRIVVCSLKGKIIDKISIPLFDSKLLENDPYNNKQARQGWLRGMAFHGENTIIVGFSPATIAAFNLESKELISKVNLSLDTRNAIHGLEIFPF